eukprot:scaffold7420_cov229-Pinguiococcus_pyrenoidosus.AAC.1
MFGCSDVRMFGCSDFLDLRLFACSDLRICGFADLRIPHEAAQRSTAAECAGPVGMVALRRASPAV